MQTCSQPLTQQLQGSRQRLPKGNWPSCGQTLPEEASQASQLTGLMSSDTLTPEAAVMAAACKPGQIVEMQLCLRRKAAFQSQHPSLIAPTSSVFSWSCSVVATILSPPHTICISGLSACTSALQQPIARQPCQRAHEADPSVLTFCPPKGRCACTFTCR